MSDWLDFVPLVVTAVCVRVFNPAYWSPRAWPCLVAYMWGARALMAFYGAAAAVAGNGWGVAAAAVLLLLSGRMNEAEGDEREHEADGRGERGDGDGRADARPYRPRPFR